MLKSLSINDHKTSGVLFLIGWGAVMLSYTVAIPPVWNTFMHSWRAELAASIFLFTVLVFLYSFHREVFGQLITSRAEFRLLVVPMCAFIAWSGLSVIWAPSWKSAIHHTLVWSMYLIFYVLVRQLLDHGSNYSKLMTMLAVTLGFFGVLAVCSYCTFLIFGSGTKLGMVYAKYGEQINTLFPLLLVGVMRLNGKRFLRGTAVLTALWLLIFCSLGRINLILFTVAAGVIALCVFSFKKFHKYRLKLVIVAAAVVLAPIPLHIFSLLSQDPGIPMVERVGDGAAISSSNNFRKLMMSLSLEMFAAHPITGIGADNFGFETNKYRAAYGAENPNDPNLAEAESDIPERAHNEYLQILAELGVVGAGIFLWFLAGIGTLIIRSLRRRQRITLYHIAAVSGLAIFLASSLVTSYSFRLIQNGFVFFFVLAVVAKLFSNGEEKADRAPAASVVRTPLKASFAAAIAACVLMFAYSTVRVSSVAFTTKANLERDLDKAIPFYETGMWLDDENPEPRYFLGLRLMEKGRYAEAVPYLQESISIGMAPSADFSYLASAQALNEDHEGAERTFSVAAALYPRSPFVLTRHAALLRNVGKIRESAAELDRAKQIDPRQTNTWWEMITVNPQAATDAAFRNKDFVAVMDLRPQIAMFAVKREREIRFPEERFFFGF